MHRDRRFSSVRMLKPMMAAFDPDNRKADIVQYFDQLAASDARVLAHEISLSNPEGNLHQCAE